VRDGLALDREVAAFNAGVRSATDGPWDLFGKLDARVRAGADPLRLPRVELHRGDVAGRPAKLAAARVGPPATRLTSQTPRRRS
jgi:hypothetical protein